MRTRPARITPACLYCDNDHDPAIPCRYRPISGRFALPEPTVVKREVQAIRDPHGKLIAVRIITDRKIIESEAP